MRLVKELDKIKNERKEEKRLIKLQKICNNVETINSAIEITKHESSLHAPILAFGVALFLFTQSFLTNGLLLILNHLALYIFLFFIIINALRWTNTYYDLLEMRINILKENNKDISTIVQTDKEHERELHVEL